VGDLSDITSKVTLLSDCCVGPLLAACPNDSALCLASSYLVITALPRQGPLPPAEKWLLTQCGSSRWCFYLAVPPVGNATLVVVNMLICNSIFPCTLPGLQGV